MASRPIYIPQKIGQVLVKTETVEFVWYPGLSVSQKQKSIASLHAAASTTRLGLKFLEVSSKSPITTGVALSAFNLVGHSRKERRRFTVETAFQSSKVFEKGGPFRDLLYASSREAKKDPRLKESGRLLHFDFFGELWDLEPKTAFYDWLYINTLNKNSDLVDDLEHYDAFTDIEFNPEKSINCQGYSVALFKALQWRGILDIALSNRRSFIEVSGYNFAKTAHEDRSIQANLI